MYYQLITLIGLLCFQGTINRSHWIFEFDLFKVLNVVNNQPG